MSVKLTLKKKDVNAMSESTIEKQIRLLQEALEKKKEKNMEKEIKKMKSEADILKEIETVKREIEKEETNAMAAKILSMDDSSVLDEIEKAEREINALMGGAPPGAKAKSAVKTKSKSKSAAPGAAPGKTSKKAGGAVAGNGLAATVKSLVREEKQFKEAVAEMTDEARILAEIAALESQLGDHGIEVAAAPTPTGRQRTPARPRAAMPPPKTPTVATPTVVTGGSGTGRPARLVKASARVVEAAEGEAAEKQQQKEDGTEAGASASAAGQKKKKSGKRRRQMGGSDAESESDATDDGEVSSDPDIAAEDEDEAFDDEGKPLATPKRSRSARTGAGTNARRNTSIATAAADDADGDGNGASTSGGGDAEANKLYCACRQRWDITRPMIGCDFCSEWYHWTCCGLTRTEANCIDKYACINCVKKRKKTIYKSMGVVDREMKEEVKLLDANALLKEIKAIQIEIVRLNPHAFAPAASATAPARAPVAASSSSAAVAAARASSSSAAAAGRTAAAAAPATPAASTFDEDDSDDGGDEAAVYEEADAADADAGAGADAGSANANGNGLENGDASAMEASTATADAADPLLAAPGLDDAPALEPDDDTGVRLPASAHSPIIGGLIGDVRPTAMMEF